MAAKAKKKALTQREVIALLPLIVYAKMKGRGYDFPEGVTQGMINTMKASGLVKTSVHSDRYGIDYMRVAAVASQSVLGSSPFRRMGDG